jgi:UDP-N-acetylglucosamine transferase subunit ALG13
VIFVTIGSMLPFDRLIRAMDNWALKNQSKKIFAQIGDGFYIPQYMPYERLVGPVAFRKILSESGLIVAHAGMGSVISAAELGKPIIIVPRDLEFKEHTTDHQKHTANWLRNRDGIYVADTIDELDNKITLALTNIAERQRISTIAPADFTDRLRAAVLT